MPDIDIVNNDDEVIGTSSAREAHDQKLLHRIAVTYVVNDKKEILVQERMDGHLDHSSAGHVDKGETYEEAARRELGEELGVKNVENVPLQYVGKSFAEIHFYKTYVTKVEPGAIQEDEVKSVFWANPHDIKKDMAANPQKYAGGFLDSIELFMKKYKF